MDIDNNLDQLLASAGLSFNGEKKLDTKYQYSYVPMIEVIKNIDEYIIPELQEACKLLWEKNIFTFMCSNRNDGGAAYIVLESLSAENIEIFKKLQTQYPEHFTLDSWRHNRFRLEISNTTKMSENKISSIFLKLANNFVEQDIQDDFYLTKEDYLLSCGCYDEVPNPNYVEDIGPMPMGTSLEELDKWLAKGREPKTIKVFSKSKMTKSFEEYIKENGDENRTDFETGNVYDSPYFLKRHLEYIELKNTDIVGV